MRDLSLHILDLVQNCVEAGAKNIALTIVEDEENDWLTFTVKDDGRGMKKEFLEQVRSPFTTSRTTRKVGLGLPLIDMSTKMSGGKLEIFSEENKGTSVNASYRYSHIDRPPLGDILTTVKIIVISYQQIFFHYEHRKNGKEFILDTKQMREILGESIDFGEGDIRQWLEDYLKQGLSELDSKVEG